MLNQKTYFAIVFRYLWGFCWYVNHIFWLKFDHFMAFWKMKFSKKYKKNSWPVILEFSLKIFLKNEKYHNLVNFWVHLSLEFSWKVRNIFNKYKDDYRRKCVFDKSGHNLILQFTIFIFLFLLHFLSTYNCLFNLTLVFIIIYCLFGQ